MSTQYQKIQSLFKRDQQGRMLFGEYSLPEFQLLKDIDWEMSEKVDGTNLRLQWAPSSGGIDFFGPARTTLGGKTDRAQIPVSLITRCLEWTEQPKRFSDVIGGTGSFTFYGEGFGPGIQKGGGKYGSEVDFVLFDIVCHGPNGDIFLQRADVEYLGSKLGMKVVPIVAVGTLAMMERLVGDGLLESQWGDFEPEGVVARPRIELQTRLGQRVIVKLKTRDFPEPEAPTLQVAA